MSDRIAVFNAGRIEQIGSPEDVYERPETEFVAGFVGVSNLLERKGRRFTIRPEKIHLLEVDESPDGFHAERGRVDEVIYVGMVTRYLIDLDAGGKLVVIRQNLERPTAHLLDERGRTVTLAWRPEHEYTVESSKREEEE